MYFTKILRGSDKADKKQLRVGFGNIYKTKVNFLDLTHMLGVAISPHTSLCCFFFL